MHCVQNFLELLDRDGVQVVDEAWKVFLNNNSKRLKNEVACIIEVTFSLNVT